MNLIAKVDVYVTFLGLTLAVVSLPFSVKICHAAILIVTINWIMQGRWVEKLNAIRSNPLVGCFVFFFVLHIVALLYTSDLANGWFSIEKKLAWVLLPIVIVSTPRIEKKLLDLVFLSFVGACFLGTIICLLHTTHAYTTVSANDPLASSLFWSLNPGASKGWISFSYVELASGIGMHPTYFSLYLIFCLIIIYKLTKENHGSISKGKQVLILALAVYLGLFIICLSSRMATIIFLIYSILATYYFLPDKKQPVRIALSFLVFISLSCLIYFNPVSRYRNFQELHFVSLPQVNTQQTLSVSIRTSLWWLGIKSAENVNAVWGTGPGDVKQTIGNMVEKYSMSNSIESTDPHNQFIFAFIGIGSVGLISLLSCLLIPWVWAYQHRDFFYIGFLSLFILVSVTETILEVQKGIVFFSLFNSLLLFQYSDWSFLYSKKVSYAKCI